MSYEMRGRVHWIGPVEQKSEKFQCRDLVVELAGQYPQFIRFQFSQMRCDCVDNLRIGDDVTVSFDLRGREWNGKYFTSLEGWKVESHSSTSHSSTSHSSTSHSSSAHSSSAHSSSAHSTTSHTTSHSSASQSSASSADYVPAPEQVDDDDDLPF